MIETHSIFIVCSRYIRWCQWIHPRRHISGKILCYMSTSPFPTLANPFSRLQDCLWLLAGLGPHIYTHRRDNKTQRVRPRKGMVSRDMERYIPRTGLHRFPGRRVVTDTIVSNDWGVCENHGDIVYRHQTKTRYVVARPITIYIEEKS